VKRNDQPVFLSLASILVYKQLPMVIINRLEAHLPCSCHKLAYSVAGVDKGRVSCKKDWCGTQGQRHYLHHDWPREMQSRLKGSRSVEKLMKVLDQIRQFQYLYHCQDWPRDAPLGARHDVERRINPLGFRSRSHERLFLHK
jgi:hypothetical protein